MEQLVVKKIKEEYNHVLGKNVVVITYNNHVEAEL